MKPSQYPQSLPPPMWCPDPAGTNRLRWWDGSKWTDHYARVPAPEPAVAAVSALPATRKPSLVTGYTRRAMPPIRANGRKSSPLADVVTAATLEEPRYPLEEQVEVVGETYRAKDIRRVFQEAGMPITESGVTLKSVRCILVPEPWNEHDPNAVAVMVGQNHVGYLAADLAASYTDGLLRIARLGSLATGEARIWAKSDDGIIRARVTILIPEASQFD
ncbi:hypothetical protein MMARJ_28720 [Mycobacterium marseillense]|uniref:DUF2510 domain-containing protein n=1 Tax=Mycobacterium marseillense TaxID=701042 RepID=A0ABM7JDX3_9MYCO|nr:hypothetical protein MMARJ_28720 [Mycobacterium marseillense]